MERKQVVDLLKRIKYNYNEFIVDDYTITGFTHNGNFGDIKVIVDDNIYN